MGTFWKCVLVKFVATEFMLTKDLVYVEFLGGIFLTFNLLPIIVFFSNTVELSNKNTCLESRIKDKNEHLAFKN